MKYLVLRNCYTAEQRYFSKGDVVELPDEMFKYEKNFAPVGEVEEQPLPKEPQTFQEVQDKMPESSMVREVQETPPTTTEESQELKNLKPGEYLCSNCSAIHRRNSKVGKRHLKYE